MPKADPLQALNTAELKQVQLTQEQLQNALLAGQRLRNAVEKTERVLRRRPGANRKLYR